VKIFKYSVKMESSYSAASTKEQKRQYSEGKYQQWKRNLAFMIKNNT